MLFCVGSPALMPMEDPERNAGNLERGAFCTTRWSLISAARDSKPSDEVKAALETLCRAYWYPLYAYTRRSGFREHDAQDLVQGFFAHLLGGDALQRVARDKGRFRSFLLAALKYYISDRRDFENAAKRGGGKPVISLEGSDPEQRYQLEPVDRLSPRELFDRQWAMALVDQALETVRQEACASGREALFQAIRELLAGDRSGRPYAVIAADLNMSEAAVKMAVMRLRQRFRDALREAVANTVSTHVELEEELANLRLALAG